MAIRGQQTSELPIRTILIERARTDAVPGRSPVCQDITHWFDDHITSELSLWQALERDLLFPYHYFGIADGTPVSGEVGVLDGRVQPGNVVAVVGAGPVGLSAMLGAQLFSPSHIVAIDLADARLDVKVVLTPNGPIMLEA